MELSRGEFKSFVIDREWKVFFLFADSINLAEGENVYHKCKLCPFETKRTNLPTMFPIDNEMAEHLYQKHYGEVHRQYIIAFSKRIASQEGQQTIEKAVDSWKPPVEDHNSQRRLF